MAEYIDREAVMSKCNDIWDNADETTQTGVDTINTIDEVVDFIESLPSADVQPVKRGKWFHINNDSFIYCSECYHEAYWDTDYGQQLFDFCPYCGAKMLKE